MKFVPPTTRESCAGARSRRTSSGFTFAEILAALMILGVLLPVIIRAVTIANRATVGADRRAIALMLTDNLLNELSVSNNWNSFGSSGTFDPPHDAYSWRVRRNSWPEDDMTELTVETLYFVQGGTNGVYLTTLVDEDAN